MMREGLETLLAVLECWRPVFTQPGFDNMLAVIEACGFDLPLQLIPRDTALNERLDKNRLLSPERRAQRYLAKLDREAANA